MRLAELAVLVGGQVHGDDGREARGIAQVDDVRDDEITFIDNPKFLPRLTGKNPAGVLVSAVVPQLPFPQIVVSNPRLAAIQLASAFVPDPVYPPGIDPLAVVEATATVDPTATVMAGVTVGAGASIGPRTVLLPQVTVGPRARIGAQCLLHPGVRVGERVTIGDRVIIHHNASLGADGFGFVRLGDEHVKVPQKGVVIVENDVEIGANTCVDRATFGRTIIGAGTKIDNLVQIGHNCLIGKRCLIVSQTGLAGSVVVGDDTVLGARAAVIPGIRIGKGCLIGGSAGIIRDLADGEMVGGFIAKDHMAWKRELAAVGRLPEALKDLKRLGLRVAALEKKE